MFRALLWKEWRQLALVRWGGIALGALLPIAFTAGAELAQRGLLPTGSVKGYAPRDLMFEVLPAALAFGLWPLIGLMSAAQAFAGDRAAGTETFLLERPVPRAAVWRARLVASLLTVAAVIAGTAALAAIAAALVGAPPAIGWSRWAILSGLGVGVGTLAYLGGLIAASLLSSPLGAVLLGAVLGAVPVVLAAQLTIVFPYARIGETFLGLVAPVFLLPAFVAASWLAFCRGEPAGRGRIRRAVTLLVAALASVLVLFVGVAPVALRANAAQGQHSIAAAPAGRKAFVGAMTTTAWGGGWLVDTATGRKLAFVPPPVQEVAWSPDGSEVAILTWSAPLGGVRRDQRIDVRSAGDGSVQRSIPMVEGGSAFALTWADAGLVAVVARESSKGRQNVEVEVVDPEAGVWRPTGFRSEGWSMGLVGPAEDHRVFVHKRVDENTQVGGAAPSGYRLYPVDVASARVGAPIADASGRTVTFAGWTSGLSPSGRYARIAADGNESGGPRIEDLRDGGDRPQAASPPRLQWISGDRFVWLDTLDHRTRMFVGAPGKPPTALREWRDAQVGIAPSPDGRAVFLSVIPASGTPTSDARRLAPDPALFEGSAPVGAAPEELVYLPDGDRFVPLGPPFSGRLNDLRYTQWAGPRTLARIAPKVVCFEDVDAPGKRRFVIGGPGDLE